MCTRSVMHVLCRLWSSPRGAALVEFALAAPFVILLLVAMTDLGFGFYYYLQVEGAAAAGAQYAAVHTFNQGNIQTAATAGSNISGIAAFANKVCVCTDNNLFALSGSYSSTTDTCSNTQGCSTTPTVFISVQTQYLYRPILPYPWAVTPVTLNGQAYRRIK